MTFYVVPEKGRRSTLAANSQETQFFDANNAAPNAGWKAELSRLAAVKAPMLAVGAGKGGRG